jgi:hypothetical protein
MNDFVDEAPAFEALSNAGTRKEAVSQKTVEDLRSLIQDALVAVFSPMADELPEELSEAWEAPKLRGAVRLFQEAYVRRALKRANGNREAAAANIGIGYSTLKTKLHRSKSSLKDSSSRALPASAKRARSTSSRKQVDMACRVEDCPNRSRGPRFGYMCEEHSKLSKRAQQAARDSWNVKNPD